MPSCADTWSDCRIVAAVDGLPLAIPAGPPRKLVGLRPSGRAPARAHAGIADQGGRALGEVTSGGFGPTVGRPVALGYVESGHAAPGTRLDLMVRERAHPAAVVELPFGPHRYKR